MIRTILILSVMLTASACGRSAIGFSEAQLKSGHWVVKLDHNLYVLAPDDTALDILMPDASHRGFTLKAVGEDGEVVYGTIWRHGSANSTTWFIVPPKSAAPAMFGDKKSFLSALSSSYGVSNPSFCAPWRIGTN